MVSNGCARVGLLVLAAIALLASAASAGAARPGALDRSFGERGRVAFDLPGEPGIALAAVAVQPDGKIVAAGSLLDGRPLVVRFLPDGALDQGFGSGGVARPDVPVIGVRGVAVQPDGKLLLGGTAAGPGHVPAAMTRLLPGGGVDEGFESAGVAIVQPEGSWAAFGSAHLSELALLPDGRIVAAGEQKAYDVHDPSNTLVARLLPNGAPDATFDGNGTAWTHFNHPSTVVTRPDGEAVVLGWEDFGLDGAALFAMRFGPGPTAPPHDDPWHDGGYYAFQRHQPIGSAAALRPDGTIVFVADLRRDRGRGTLAWLRLGPDLRLLARGVVDGDGAQAAGFDERGAVIAAGRANDRPLAAFGVRRYRGRRLTRDPGFGARRGRTALDVEDPSGLIGVVPHGDKVVVAGVTRSADGRPASPLTLFRLHAHRDTEDPAVSVHALAPPRFCIAGSPTVAVIARDDLPVRVLVRIDGRRVERSRRRRTIVEIDTARIAPGRHTLTMIARDTAGNRTRVDRAFRVCPRGVN